MCILRFLSIHAMSVNYATGLSPYDHKGTVGMPELYDGVDKLNEKIDILLRWLKDANNLVIHTGAGISTACGIPDFRIMGAFRGPNGVWTLEKEGKLPRLNVTFDNAQPSYTHRAVCALEDCGKLKFLVTQNVDGLHLRSGFPRDRMAELHGNMFVEQCERCKKGKMRDTILDWEDELPERELSRAEFYSKQSDLNLVLGSSLQIQPAAKLPTLGKRLVIVNLQETKQDKKADLIIHAKVDQVMELLIRALNLQDSKVFHRACPTVVLNSRHGPVEDPDPPKPKKRKRAGKCEELTVKVGIENSEPHLCRNDLNDIIFDMQDSDSRDAKKNDDCKSEVDVLNR